MVSYCSSWVVNMGTTWSSSAQHYNLFDPHKYKITYLIATLDLSSILTLGLNQTFEFWMNALKFHVGEKSLLNSYLYFLLIKNGKALKKGGYNGLLWQLTDGYFWPKRSLTIEDQRVTDIPHFGHLLINGMTPSNWSPYNNDVPVICALPAVVFDGNLPLFLD